MIDTHLRCPGNRPICSLLEASMLKSVRNLLRFMMRFLLVLTGLHLPGLYRRLSYAFVVYGSQRDKDEGWPRWLQRYLNRKLEQRRRRYDNPKYQLLLPMSLMHIRGSWGVVFATFETQEAFSANPSLAVQALQQARQLCPKAHVIAGAGQFGSWMHQVDGFVPQRPFTTGQLGTLFTMYESTQQLAKLASLHPSKGTLAVLGGAGHIGSTLTHMLAKEFKEVLAIDPRFEHQAGQDSTPGQPRESSAPCLVQQADLVLVLTPRGDDILPYVPYLKEGAVVGFDTHPGPSLSTLQRLIPTTTSIYQIRMVNELTPLRTIPKLQGYEPQDVVGCLLTALVYLMKQDVSFIEYSNTCTSEQRKHFFSSARLLGFAPKLTLPTRAKELSNLPLKVTQETHPFSEASSARTHNV